ncbi:MAG: hydrogen gas-evolving membrane-bound hydrogenase subunit E [Ilumatobacteraceae bacterium]
MIVILALHLVVGITVLALAGPLAARHWPLFALAGVPALATVVWLAAALPTIIDGGVRTSTTQWIPQLGLDFDLRLDGFAALMLVLVAGVGVLVVAYAARYFTHPTTRNGRLLGLLVLFGGAMTGLVLADNLLVLYGFWELTSVTSFLLIGNDHEEPEARAAALHALLVTGAGALAMLGGFIVLGRAAGTYSLSAILQDPPSGTAVTVALVLILLGAFTKSAQMPFHSWLPGAMVAPTPVSTYLHSATMVKAGVYLIARLAPVYATVDMWRPVVVTVGVVTMVGGGLRALRQHDLKLLLAYGTISQLGFMVAVFGWGTAASETAGCVMLLAHGAFKAAAFMVVGIVDHQYGTRDVRRVPRPGPGWGPAMIVAVIASASMAGVPLLFGFIAKEADFAAFVDQGAGAALALAGMVLGSVLTAAYSLRFVAGIAGRLAAPAPKPTEARQRPGHGPPTWSFVLPAAVLACASVAFGVVPRLLDGVVGAAADSLDAAVGDVHLALWHGFTVELALSAFALAGGVLLFLGRRPVGAVLALGGHLPSASRAYLRTLRGLNTVADRTTKVTQPGSLPLYLGVILLTAAVVPGILLLGGDWWPGWPHVVEVPVHVPIAAMLIVLALAASIVRRRFSGALFLGMVGYSMAGLFIIQGAPDLALTQVAIETLSTVLFVLVLRRLPDRFETAPGAARRTVRVLIATTVGAFVFLFTIAVGSIDPPTTVSDTMIEQAYPQGDGRNVVNVILVDIRGLDTLGEITVLAAAAVGTVALARAGRRPGAPAATGVRRERQPPPMPVARLVTIDVSVRIVFAAVMVGSVWLLFAGHNQPGGGFVGGIVAGAAVSLRYVAGGLPEVRRLSRGKPWLVLGSGVAISAATAIMPLLMGGAVLQTGAHTFDLPVLGEMKVTSALVFDIGVYLAVIGLALMVFESFGDDTRTLVAPEGPGPSIEQSPAAVGQEGFA